MDVAIQGAQPRGGENPAAERRDRLCRQIRRHAELYFRFDRPEIDDKEFDALLEELAQLEHAHPWLRTHDSPTRMVGYEMPRERWAFNHVRPMLSLHAVHTLEDLRRFHERVALGVGTNHVEYAIEPKLDGVAVELRYECGRLIQALTRGDGHRGHDVTAAVRASGAMRITLPDCVAYHEGLRARGEMVMARPEYLQMCELMRECGQVPYVSPRHAVSASLRQQDLRVTALRGLRFYCYEAVHKFSKTYDTHSDAVRTLQRFGLPVIPRQRIAVGMDAMVEHCRALSGERASFDYGTDGVVVKVNRLDWQDRLGDGERAPNWAVAYKPFAGSGGLE